MLKSYKKPYHEDVADDDGGGAGLGEEGDEGPQAQAAERVEGVPAVGAAIKFREISPNYFVASAKICNVILCKTSRIW